MLCGLLLALALLASPATAVAAVEPRDIALTPADLPPGFSVDESRTRDEYVRNAGPGHRRDLNREPSPSNLADGPVAVSQFIIRLEASFGAGEALTRVRQWLIDEVGLQPSEAGPNDGGTFTLQTGPRQFREGLLMVYCVGFIKENMIIVTLVGGLPENVSPAVALHLAGFSSAKLDALLVDSGVRVP